MVFPSVIQAISATLTGEVIFEKGRAQQTNFHNHPFMRMNEVPKIEIHLKLIEQPPLPQLDENDGDTDEMSRIRSLACD